MKLKVNHGVEEYIFEYAIVSLIILIPFLAIYTFKKLVHFNRLKLSLYS